jgi:hypothetical protein
LLVALGAAATLRPTGDELQAGLDRAFTGAERPWLLHTIPLSAIVWFALAVIALAAVLALRTALGARVTAIAAVAVAAADMAHFAHGLQPMGPRDRIVPPKPASVAFLQRHARRERVVAVGRRNPLLADSVMLYGLRDVRGQDPPEPGDRYSRLLKLAEAIPTGLGFGKASPAARRVLDVLDVRWIVQEPGANPVRGPGLTVAYRGRDAVVYRNATAAPRASVPTSVVRARDADAAYAALLAPGFDPRRDAVVEGAYAKPGQGVVALTREGDATVELRATMRTAGLVVLNESLERGWRVDVDGRPADPVRVDAVLRGVIVPAGVHRVRWRYRVPGLAAGSAVSALGLVAATTWIGALAVMALRRRGAR